MTPSTTTPQPDQAGEVAEAATGTAAIPCTAAILLLSQEGVGNASAADVVHVATALQGEPTADW